MRLTWGRELAKGADREVFDRRDERRRRRYRAFILRTGLAQAVRGKSFLTNAVKERDGVVLLPVRFTLFLPVRAQIGTP
jgi:hypothetical protein